ncbi:MAG: DUF695 domain-containing protein [Turicibacter sp.]|nr:DUF695 domain-containing protein [Turicibacter sp.]
MKNANNKGRKAVETFSQAWNFFPALLDEKEHSIRFDEAVNGLDEPTKAHFSHTLEVVVYANEVTEKDFPTRAELERLNQIEDNLDCGDFEMRLIAVVTGGGAMRFVLCYNGDATAEEMAKTLLGENWQESDYRSILDDNFSHFYNNLAPNPYERQYILNRMVCTNMENEGELFQTPREIDFFCDFATEEYVQAVSEKLVRLGLTEVKRDKLEFEDGERYTLHMVFVGIPIFREINEMTYDILDALQGTDGAFDGWGAPIHKE